MFEKSFFRKECLRKRRDMDLRDETEKISVYLYSFFKQNCYDCVGLYYPIKNEFFNTLKRAFFRHAYIIIYLWLFYFFFRQVF